MDWAGQRGSSIDLKKWLCGAGPSIEELTDVEKQGRKKDLAGYVLLPTSLSCHMMGPRWRGSIGSCG